VRTAGWAGSARVLPIGGRQGAPPKPRAACGKRARPARLRLPARRRLAANGGVLNITAAVWTAGLHWSRSGNKKQMQNVSEYMLSVTCSMPG